MVVMERLRSQLSRLLGLLQLIIIQSHAFQQWVPTSSMCASSHVPAHNTGPAPPLPQLPKQYSMRVEANILQKSWTTEVEEHYDDIHQRASISVTRNGTTITSIFNFNAGERYDIYPNGTCQTNPTAVDYYGFVTLSKQNKPIMATVNEVFRFGAGFNQTYIGKETVRGIRVNHWTSCQEWSQGAKFQLDYYFSDPDFTSAAGIDQIPIRAVLNGSAHNVGMFSEHVDGTHNFQHIYEFTSFRVGPTLDDDVFRIPPGIICTGRSDASRPLPKLPDRFQMSSEIVLLDKSVHPRQESVRYDYTHKLVETWSSLIVPEGLDIRKAYMGQDSITQDDLSIVTGTVVEDFNNGVIYVMEKINMSCAVRKMPASQQSVGMTHGPNLLTLSQSKAGGMSQFQYQGAATIRQMPADVWAMEADGMVLEVYFLQEPSTSSYQSLIGMFMKNRTAVGFQNQLPKLFEMFPPDSTSGNGSPSQASLPDAPSSNPYPSMTGDQLAWGLQLERLLDQGISKKMINIFHYMPLHTDSTNFQVSQCYHEDQISQVMLVVMTKYEQDVIINFAAFSNSLRDALAEKLGVSLLQISNLVPLPLKHAALGIDATKVTLTLLGAAPVAGVQQKPIDQIKKDLVAAIQKGIIFRVQYTSYSKDFTVDKSAFAVDYDDILKTHAPQVPNTQTPQPQSGEDAQDQDAMISQKVSKSESGTSYSSGSVAGIAFATFILGAVMCVGVLFLLYRRKHPGETIIPYKRTT